MKNTNPQRPAPKPSWLKVKLPTEKGYAEVVSLLKKHSLYTVCQGARCPNRSECWETKTATFMILGRRCTRACRFCSVLHEKPNALPDPKEPSAVAKAAKTLGLSHVVVTSVTRDDLPDGGAKYFADTVREIGKAIKDASVEVLVPDFKGNAKAVKTVLDSKPNVFAHNLETVPSLYKYVRIGADFDRSIRVLKEAARSGALTKTGIMVGLGETYDELIHLFKTAASAGVKILTIGQYLRPDKNSVPVSRYLEPKEFEDLKYAAEKCGIPVVISGPLVRSSYRAEEAYKRALTLTRRSFPLNSHGF